METVPHKHIAINVVECLRLKPPNAREGGGVSYEDGTQMQTHKHVHRTYPIHT